MQHRNRAVQVHEVQLPETILTKRCINSQQEF